jgi:hypothetical protein
LAVSPIDGRYSSKTSSLKAYFSECALIKYRVKVEVEYFLALCAIPLPQLSSFDSSLSEKLRDIYRNFMMLDTNSIASGADTATEVEAAYEPTNVKADDFESCTDEFVDGILDLAGMEDEDYTFQRSMVVNVFEVAQVLSIGRSNLSSEYITSKLLSLLGDGDKTESVMEQMAAEEVTRMAGDDEEDEIEDQEG